MESSNSEKNLYMKDTSTANGNSKLYLVLIVVGLCFAIAAFIISIVSLSQRNGSSPSVVNIGSNGGVTSADYEDDKVWLIHSNHGGANTEYFDEETGKLAGFNPDFWNAVCRIANKNCQVVVDIWTNCWDTHAGEAARGGLGLMSGWYDACGGWRIKVERQRTFAFTEPYTKSPEQAFATLPNNPRNFNWRDLTGKTIGFVDGAAGDEHCLAQAEGIVGANLPAENIIHCFDFDECFAKLQAETIDAMFSNTLFFRGRTDVDHETLQACPVKGSAMMTRFDSKLMEWWNPAQEKLLASKEYHLICDDVKVAHGNIPGDAPEDICIGYS